jgi:hypothetical protein
MTKTWVERNAGQVGVSVRALLRCGPMTYDDLATATAYSNSAVRAACRLLKVVPAGKGKRLGTSGKFPTLWALPKEKRR